ncbi:IS21 family transposase, partial [Lentilactobacillus sp. TOM.63]|nr:IS21 family transposase [Lentilactobacillus sp. TOM.63]
MKKLALYSKIIDLKEKGFSRRSIATKLNISRNTVKAYLDRDEEEMTEWLASTRKRKKVLDDYQVTILDWLKKNPDMSAAQ